MVKIRLKRIGAAKNPKYRMVVADGRVKRDGRVIEEIGFYDPKKNPAEIRIDEEAALKWLRTGAQPTETARELLKKIGAFEKIAAK
jgi:small subunit ribosomal protein S16